MSYSQKYTLVSFLSPLAEGSEFDMRDWPLEITVADVFALDLTNTVRYRLAELVVLQHSVEVIAGDDAVLGKTPVVLIHPNAALLDLHANIIEFLIANGAAFNNPEFAGDGYIPHCTIQKTGRLATGDHVPISTVSLVDMFPSGDWRRRKVLQNFQLYAN